MPQSYEGLAIFIILLPGFVALLVHRALSYQQQETSPIIIARALAYSFVTYELWAALCARFTGLPDIWGIVKSATFDPWLIGGLLVIGAALGLVLAWLTEYDVFMRIARALGLTKRTANASLWLDIFHEYYPMKPDNEPCRLVEIWQGLWKYRNDKKGDVWCTVMLTDGRKVNGWPDSFADEYSGGPVLLLNRAKWLAGDGKEDVDIPDPGILLNGSQIRWIEFALDVEEEDIEEEVTGKDTGSSSLP